MRRTLHTVSCELAPILHQATQAFRLAEIRRQYRYFGANESEIAAIRDQILRILEDGPLSGRQIEHSALSNPNQEGRTASLVIRTILKEMWEEGTLCYLNLSNRMDREDRRYGILGREFPDLDLNQMDVEMAQRRLVFAHVDSYGPVTVKDMAWWSGLGVSKINSIIPSLGKSVISISVEGFSEEFLISRQIVESWQFSKSIEPWAEFLAHEDPSLKGYYQSRRRYVRDAYVSKLFNEIGEARASIVCSGEIVGIWELDREQCRIRPWFFRRLNRDETKLVKGALTKLLSFVEAEAATDKRWTSD